MVKNKILVIHGSEHLANDIVEMLVYDGFDAICAYSGDEGLKRIYEYRPDLVLCGVVIPRLSGRDVLSKIRSDPVLTTTMFVYLSHTPSDQLNEWLRSGMDLGADDYLFLPFTHDQIIACFQARFRRRAQLLGLPTDEFEKPIKRLEHHVFLSYSRKDMLIMQRIRDDLRQRQITVWTDESLKPGTPAWATAIQNAIENTGCMVVVLSPDAKQSEWVNIELGYGKTYEIRSFPVLARGTERDAIPISLINAQFSDIRSNYDTQLEKLVSAIRDHIGIIG